MCPAGATANVRGRKLCVRPGIRACVSLRAAAVSKHDGAGRIAAPAPPPALRRSPSASDTDRGRAAANYSTRRRRGRPASRAVETPRHVESGAMLLTSLAVAGFSVVVAALLFVAYAVFVRVPGKSARSVLSCAALLAALCAIQAGHLQYFVGHGEPLGQWYYRLGLFLVPSAFYWFGRWAILPTEPFRPAMLLHLLPILLLFTGNLSVSLPILFTFGAAYSLWLGWLVYGLRERRRQFRFEFMFFAVMFVLAMIVLAVGFAIPHIGTAWFYYTYNLACGIGLAIMVVALVADPELIGNLSEAARVKYGASTLRGVDVDAQLLRLEQLMTEGRAFQNENLGLASLAAELGISSHQLSELVNSRLGVGFSRYVRERRVQAAQRLLVAAPAQSILSVSMDTGFRSQSAFYAAFKEVTGQSPGDYRESMACKGRARAPP
jgi:AraC-like DNA-binding protein